MHYVGHSQGTTLALAALAQEGSLARETVSIAVLLAPVAFAGHTRSLLLRALADLRTPECGALRCRRGQRWCGVCRPLLAG